MTERERARRDLKRVLDGAARRLLAEDVDQDTVGPTTGAHGRAAHGRSDRVTPLGERESIPVVDDVNRVRGLKAA
jgi:hypothetical protein